MEISSTRRLLAVIISALIAFSTALTVSSFVIGSTLGSQEFFSSNAVTGGIASQCEEQLSAKYRALEAQSGIPASVFETVKLEYPIDISLKTAFQNIFSSENPELYNDALVEHFETLCTDYLDGNKKNYNKEYIRNTAEEAARIFSETAGLHHMGTAADKIAALKSRCHLYTLIGLIADAVLILLLLMLFGKFKRCAVYVFGSVAGGMTGTTAASLLCKVVSPLRTLNITPEIYKEAMISVFGKSMLYLAAASVLAAAVSWTAALIYYKHHHKK